MYRSILPLCVFLTLAAYGQTGMRTNVSTFDVVPLAANDHYNGSDLRNGFWNGHFFYRNAYDTAWKLWSGFAVSNEKDTLTGDFTNEYSPITGGGINGTQNYAVCYGKGTLIPEKSTGMTGFYVTNTTYGYRTLKNGSGFSKKFGGAGGNDPDWFRLRITNYSGGSTDTLLFYLADYRFSNKQDDYILNRWTWVDLDKFPSTDSLELTFESSDTGQFGINTPAYVALDDVNTVDPKDFNYLGKSFKFNDPGFFKNGNMWDGSTDTSGGFLLDGLYFENRYNSQWDIWSGWAVSKDRDSSQTGPSAQYAAMPGRSVSDKDSGFAISYGRSVIRFPMPVLVWLRFDYTNDAYTYKSMKFGDGFSKKFGGNSGNDPDYLKFTMIGYNEANQPVDTIGANDWNELLLADYRNSSKMLLKSWANSTVFFNHIIKRIEFQMESSDTGQFGMNTPAYFCLGRLFFFFESVEKVKSSHLKIYPNPSEGLIHFGLNHPETVEITDMMGKVVFFNDQNPGNSLDVSMLPAGIYVLKAKEGSSAFFGKFVKE